MPQPLTDEQFWAKVNIGGPDDCWEWQGHVGAGGYGLVGRYCRLHKAHRMAWVIINGDIPRGLFCLHRCDNPPCCNPNHLYIGTRMDNVRDRERRRRGGYEKISGERNYGAKLTEEQVKVLRSRYAAGGVTQVALAKEHGVSQSAVSLIVTGRKWKRVARANVCTG